MTTLESPRTLKGSKFSERVTMATKSIPVTVATTTNSQAVSVYRGEDVALNCTFAANTNITGWTLSFTVRDRLGGNVLFQKTTSAGITITSPSTGAFTVSVASADTATATGTGCGAWVYDICRVDSGNDTVLATGAFKVLPGVTVP